MIRFSVRLRRASLIVLAAAWLAASLTLFGTQQTLAQKTFLQRLVAVAIERTSHHVRYDST
jgi:hypothetical protein